MDFENLSQFEPSELRHYAKRAKIYALDKENSLLHSVAWKMTNGKELTEKECSSLKQALKRIANIPKLDSTCINQDCEVCNKLVSLLGKEFKRSPCKLNLELYRWQKECKKRWKENGAEGIVKVVTGAGKTVLALSLIEELHQKYNGKELRTIIVVPTTALLDQWLEELTDTLNIPRKEIGTYYAESKDELLKNKVFLYVINSAREHLVDHLKRNNDDLFLIVDECHRAGSEKNRAVFEGRFDYTLGLSATPKRKSDYGFEKILTKNLGEVIYTYSYQKAREDEIIPPYRLIRVAVPLTKREYYLYERYSKRLKKIVSKLMRRYPELQYVEEDNFFKELGRLKKEYKDELIEKFILMSNQRKSIIHESKSKIASLKYLIKNRIDTRARILIFHERTEIADEIDEYLKENNIESTVYHTGLKKEERRNNLSDYRDGKKNILIACRALDEGLDVPNTSVGIIVAATSSVRQRIQRIGRILRRYPGKDYSEIYTIHIKELEERIFSKEDIKNLENSASKVSKIEMGFD